MDRYRAVEYLFDCRADRPSCDDTVFWRETGAKEDEEDVEALDIGGIMAMEMAVWKYYENVFQFGVSKRDKACGGGRALLMIVFPDDFPYRIGDPVAVKRPPQVHPKVLCVSQSTASIALM